MPALCDDLFQKPNPIRLMLIYTHAVTERCRYIFELIFTHILYLDYTVTDDPEQYSRHTKPKLAYTNTPPADGFFIEAQSLLFEHEIHPIQITPFPYAGTQAFFQTQTGRLPFDLFAASFYLVTRYEEYLPFHPDEYGRYPAKNSAAARHGFLLTPVINCWARELKNLLVQSFPSLHFGKGKFEAVVSIDIDRAYAYNGRSLLRSAFAFCKDLARFNIKNASNRIRVIAAGAPDPYDTYQELHDMVSGYPAKLIFFFLLARHNSRFDRNLSPASAKLQQLIRQTGAVFETGIHPSYYSMEQPMLMLSEKKRLEQILGRPVVKSRQHYLRFRLPGTYQQLEAAGITDDYSMGYAETPGFRAGICTPFIYFDLKTNRTTALRVHPVTCMEGSFMEDMRMQPAESVKIIRQLINAVKQVNGTFLCIWHNHTISETGVYRGWKIVLQQTLRMLHEAG